MKIFTKSFISIVLLLLTSGITYSQEFLVIVPSTDKSYDLFIPIKAGGSFQFQIAVKNLTTTTTCTVSIDQLAMGTVQSWISIDNNSQTIVPGQTVTYILTVNVPTNADDSDYPLPLYFIAKEASNGDHSFSYRNQTIIVDKSVPQVPTFSVNPTSKTVYVSSWQSFDSRSLGYTNKNQSSGINGIKNYNVTLLNSNNSVVSSKEFKATEYNYYTFSGLSSNTDYKVKVTAYDLAGNLNSAEKTTKTAPPAPTLTLSKASFCYINLTWTASAGATGYVLYNATNTTPVEVITTTATSYSVTQSITPGTPYKFYVRAMNSSNLKSDNSNTLSFSTPALPTPIISGNPTVCTAGSTFTVSNLPSDCTLSWDKGSYLSIYSTSGNSATFKATGVGTTSITAKFNTVCATATKNYIVDAGSPKPGPVSIQWNAPPNRFTASIGGMVSATSYKWYLNGVLKFDGLMDVVIFQRQVTNCGFRYDVDVAMLNACGVSPISHTEVYEPPCLKSFIIYPNPANSEITIAQNEELATASADQNEVKMIKSFKIVDDFGMTYLDKKLDKLTKSTTVNISNLKTGLYQVIVNAGTEAESYTLIKN